MDVCGCLIGLLPRGFHPRRRRAAREQRMHGTNRKTSALGLAECFILAVGVLFNGSETSEEELDAETTL